MIAFRQNYTSLPYTYQCQEQTQRLRNGDGPLKRRELRVICRMGPARQVLTGFYWRVGSLACRDLCSMLLDWDRNNSTWDKREVQRPVQDETAQIVNKEIRGQQVQLCECFRSFIYRSFIQQELNLHYCKTQVHKFFYRGEFFMTLKFYIALNTNTWVSVNRKKIWY